MEAELQPNEDEVETIPSRESHDQKDGIGIDIKESDSQLILTASDGSSGDRDGGGTTANSMDRLGGGGTPNGASRAVKDGRSSKVR